MAGRKRSEGSLLTKLENMKINGEIFANVSSSFAGYCIHSISRKLENRKYTQHTVYVSENGTYSSISDFKRLVHIKRNK